MKTETVNPARMPGRRMLRVPAHRNRMQRPMTARKWKPTLRVAHSGQQPEVTEMTAQDEILHPGLHLESGRKLRPLSCSPP
jgi:hypothetical protein